MIPPTTPFQVMLQKQTPAQYTGRVFGLVSSLTQFEYVISGRADEERLAFVRKRFARIQSAYVALINEAVNRGELHPRLAVEDALRFAFSANDGMHLDWLINGGRQSRIVRQREMLVEYLQYALCPE